MSPRNINEAAAQLERLMHVIPALRDEEPHTLRELANIVGTSEAIIARDLRTLVTRAEDEVTPGGFVEGLQLAFGTDAVQLRSPHFRRPMGLSPAELAALEFGLGALERELPPPEAHQAESARKNIAKAAPWLAIAERLPTAHAEAVADEVGDVLAVLRRAVDTRRKVTLGYRSGSATTSIERTVHPYGLLASKGKWYLLGWCEQKKAIRIFRLDRISAPRILDEPADVPDNVRLEEQLAHGRALVNHAEEHMVVRYSAKIARWIVEHEEAVEQPDGSVLVTYPLLDDAWAVRHVLGYGPDAEVVEPVRVRELVLDRLRAVVA